MDSIESAPPLVSSSDRVSPTLPVEKKMPFQPIVSLLTIRKVVVISRVCNKNCISFRKFSIKADLNFLMATLNPSCLGPFK